MTPVALVAVVTVAAIVGAWAHELSHAVAARLVGADLVAVDLWQLDVAYRLDDDVALWRVRAVGLAPAISGGVVGIAWYLLWGVPTSDLGVAAGIGWAVWTCWLSPSDLSPRVAQERFETHHG